MAEWPVREQPTTNSAVNATLRACCCFESLPAWREGEWLCVRVGEVLGWTCVMDETGVCYLLSDEEGEGEREERALLGLREQLISAMPEVS